MKNSKIRRALLLAACAVLLVVMSVGATLAYLTSADRVTNTFTVGNVQIILDEEDVDNSQTDVTKGSNPARDRANAYHLQPNQTYKKDPMVTVRAGSDNCYVRAIITIKDAKDLEAVIAAHGYGLDEIFSNLAIGGETAECAWTVVGNADPGTAGNGSRTYTVYYTGEKLVEGTQYVGAVDADTELEKFFTEIKIPATVTNGELASISDLKIDIVAQAIQADGFTGAAAAWTAFETEQK